MSPYKKLSFILTIVFVLIDAGLFAQIDPKQRQLLQFGYNQPFRGHTPIAGYAFYYLNSPGFPVTNQTLRLAVAPVYMDAELGIGKALGKNTDIGIGVEGGGFIDSYSEVRDGVFLEDESFTGHGAGASVSLYHNFTPQSRIPLYGIIRGAAHQSVFSRDDETAAGFEMPDDHASFNLRTGLRLGGTEPQIDNSAAMELSIWHETHLRTDSDAYGYNGDRKIEPASHLFLGRALLAYSIPNTEHKFQIRLTGGTSVNPDRLSAFRLGGLLPLASEFPLPIPGYYYQEISAEHFALLDGKYSVPFGPDNSWHITSFASGAMVDNLPGFEQSGNWHSGVGAGIGYSSPSKFWRFLVGYSYGITARREKSHGANSIFFLCQINLEAARDKVSEPIEHYFFDKLKGLKRILGK
ncbi:MAG: hypothetical protein K9N48_03655 [Verrucomicrobia bacterium]|nr:hypothetical protein [Verrucomicrobiota bacterium]MCF7708677.1 hypothetical protein [Verrucomicrobiota bacterium]